MRRLAEDLAPGFDDSRFVGPGLEFAQTRAFMPGDPVRAIDWRVTARTGKAHVKERVATRRMPLYVVCDTSASMLATSTPVSKHAAAVWIAGVLAMVGLARGSAVSVLSGDRGAAGGSGDFEGASRWRVWSALHALRRADGSGTHDLGAALERIEEFARVVSTVVVVSDFHEPGLVDALRRLGARHDCLAAQMQDPAETGMRGIGIVRGVEAETGRAMLLTRRSSVGAHAEAIRAALAGAGVDHALVRTERPILPELARLLELHGPGKRGAR